MPNEVTKKYIEECLDGTPGLRTVRDRTDLPPVFDECYGDVLLPRPLFAEESELRSFADDLTSVFWLLVSLPRRLFDGDVHGYCAAAGIDERLAALMTRDAATPPPLFGRSDAYHDGSSFKLLEFNVGTELGGMDFAELNRALLGVDDFADFAARAGLGSVDTAELVADVLREVSAPVRGGDRPVVAMLETTGGIAAHPNYRAVQEAFVRQGIDFRLGEVQQVSLDGGRLVLDGTPLDVALRFFAAGEILDCPDGVGILDPIYKAHDAGGTILFTTLASSLFGSKGGLALLSDGRFRSAFAPAELAVIDRVIPWTRVVARGSSPEGGFAELLDRCRAEREHLVLKPCVGWGSAGAVVGRETTDREWCEMLEARADRGHVVQRLVMPVAEPVYDRDAEGQVADWHANWGVFVTPLGYSGSFVRALRPDDGSIITYGNKRARGTGVFSFQ